MGYLTLALKLTLIEMDFYMGYVYIGFV